MKGDGLNSPNNKQPHDAVSEIAGVLGRPPEIVGEPLRDSVRVTRQWGHGALHDTLAGLNEHVVMTYYGRWDIGGSIEVSHVYIPDRGHRRCSRCRISDAFLICGRLPEGFGHDTP